MRIYTKLIILSLSLSILPLILVAGIFLFSTQKELKTEISDRLNAVSVLKKNKLETFLNSRKEDLRAIQGFLDVKINLPTLEQFDRDRYNFAYLKAKGQLDDQLNAFMSSYKYADILFLDTKGKVVFVTNSDHVGKYLNNTLFFEEVLNKARSGIYSTNPIATKDEKYPYVLYMISQALDIQEKFIGYIVLEVDMNLIFDLISDNTGIGKTGESFLVMKKEGAQAMAISPLSNDPKVILNKTMSFKDLPIDNKVHESVDYQGKEVLAMRQSIPSLNWELITKIDKQEVFASVNSIRTLFFIICLLILVIIILGSIFFAEFILDPIQKLYLMTIHDPLTGVLNRRGLQDVLSKTFMMAQRMKMSVQVLLMDLDDFKQINDRHGHGVGDAMLVAATEKIRQTIRQTDYIARVGGDEFMVLLLDSKEADSLKIADKIRLAIAETSVKNSSGQNVKMTCSMGMVPLGDKIISINMLLQKLHQSLHLSKTEGKNRVVSNGKSRMKKI